MESLLDPFSFDPTIVIHNRSNSVGDFNLLLPSQNKLTVKFN